MVVPREDLALAVERACQVPVYVLRFGLVVPRENLALAVERACQVPVHMLRFGLAGPERYQYRC